jgi:DNA-binding transcriptional regulator YdaS (Cro superfamily)
MDAIKQAIEIIGWPAKVAKLLTNAGFPCKQQFVHSWLYERTNKAYRPVPPNMAMSLEKLTNGAVRAEDLRPDFDWAALRGTKVEAK